MASVSQLNPERVADSQSLVYVVDAGTERLPWNHQEKPIVSTYPFIRYIIVVYISLNNIADI